MLQALIVTLREGAEAALVAAIALTYLTKDRTEDRPQPSRKFVDAAPAEPMAPVE